MGHVLTLNHLPAVSRFENKTEVAGYIAHKESGIFLALSTSDTLQVMRYSLLS